MVAPYISRSAREPVSYASRWRKFALSLVEPDLTAAANGASQDFVLGFIPPGAVIHPVPNIKLIAQFTGGAASSVGLSVGTAAAPTLIATSFDILGSAASGLFTPMAAGAQRVSPGVHPNGGQTLIARITPDGAHALAGLTTGSLQLEVYYVLPDGKYG